MADVKKIPNSLINEKSPYLLQHAYNPVNWYPWGEEAFSKAKAENKPVFLSIGYSTCHWCHVMAHESFEDEEAAEFLNQNYVSIKVDREERPDIDSVYMSVCQALTGSGGWPLTIIMTPDQKPFYAATYLPKIPRWGSAGLLDVLDSILKLWKNEKNRLIEAGDEMTRFLNDSQKPSSEYGGPAEDFLLSAVRSLKRSFDEKWGGFGRAPKFPTPHNLIFLLRQNFFKEDETARFMAEKTLKQMYRGGIYDHIGGGFSRYSTDEKWLVPHFEKMLYDNALLLYAYAEAFQMTGDSLYAAVSQGIIDYILGVLTDEQGGFYCGQDADSEGIEGKFYTLGKKEIEDVLGEQEAGEFCRWFGVTDEGNFEGKNIPNLIENENYKTRNESIRKSCQKLYEYRLKRTVLHTDDKILTSWNGLMIAAIAKAYKILGDNRCLDAARKARTFIIENLKADNGRLFIRYRDGQAVHDGQLDDYAFYAFGLLELYEASFDIRCLEESIKISEKMLELFFDEANGGFYMYAHDRDKLISRPKELYDGALPSGNSVAAYVLSRLYHLTGEIKWQNSLEKQISYLSQEVRRSPASYCFCLLALQSVLYPSTEIVCVASEKNSLNELKDLQKGIKPNFSVIVKTPGNEEILSKVAPYTKDYPVPSEGCRYYVCRGGSCMQPADSIDDLKNELDKMQ